jgi:hypothetical protein
MLTLNLALVSEIQDHDPADLATVAAALQRQAIRDFSPIWNQEGATVDAFPTLEDVPVGYWPMIIVPDVRNASGFHEDQNGQPFALIEMSDSWSLTASHEMLEMIADPWGSRLVPGRSIKEDQGRVEYLVEVCDPSEADAFAYTVNDVLVSDFYSPRFFDPEPVPGVRYSFTGAITAPRQVLRGGYLSWRDPVSDDWWQQTWFQGDAPTFRNLGPLDAAQFSSPREFIDQKTEHPGIEKGLPATSRALQGAVRAGEVGSEASRSRAAALRERYRKLIEDSNA